MDKPGKIVWVESSQTGYFPFFNATFNSGAGVLSSLEKLKTPLISQISEDAKYESELLEDYSLARIMSLLAIDISTSNIEFYSNLLREYIDWEDPIFNTNVLIPFIDPYIVRNIAKYIMIIINKYASESALNSDLFDNSIRNDIDTFRRAIKKIKPYVGTEKVIQSAILSGLPVSRLYSRVACYVIGQGRFSKRILHQFSSETSHIAVSVTTNKSLCSTILNSAGLPVPSHAVVNNLEGALKVVERLNYPVVVKPLNKDMGVGVTVNIKNKGELESAIQNATKYGPLMVEKYIAGEDFRFFIVNGRIAGVTKRVPPVLVGNGKDSISTLFNTFMRDRKRDKFLRNYSNFSLDDIEIQDQIKIQGVRNSSILKRGQEVLLRSNANVSTGGRDESVTSRVHPDNNNMALFAADVVGLDIAGIDFITTDIAKSWKEVGGGICEINPTPALSADAGASMIIKDFIQEFPKHRLAVVVILKDEWDSDVIKTLVDDAEQSDYCKVVRDGNYSNAIIDFSAAYASKKLRSILFFVKADTLFTRGFSLDRIDIILSNNVLEMRDRMLSCKLLPLREGTKLYDASLDSVALSKIRDVIQFGHR